MNNNLHLLHEDHDDDHDGGLQHDLNTLSRFSADRRNFLRLFAAGLVALPVIGCDTSSTDDNGSTADACKTVIPEETAGPYPGDGSNSNGSGVANALAMTGIVRSDMRSSFGSAGTNTATGLKLTITLKLVNTNNNCAPLSGYAIYLWHCDKEGRYSMYSSGVINENYLRAVQATDSNGTATFTTIVPGCYDGRFPHMHFEVYPSLAKATSAANKIKTSQLTFPTTSLNTAYGASGYETSKTNMAKTSLATDNIFSDGSSAQIATMSGNNADGYTASLDIGISV